MGRKLSTERTYTLRQYENLKLYDEIWIPEEREFDLEFIEKVRQLQFIQMDLQFRRYVEQSSRIAQYNTLDEQINKLEEVKANLLDNLFKEKEKENG